MCDIVNLCIKNGKNSSLGQYIDKNNMYKLVMPLIDTNKVNLNVPDSYYDNMNHSILMNSDVSGVIKGTHLSGSITLLQNGKFLKCLKKECKGKNAYMICHNLIAQRQMYHIEKEMYGSVVPGCIIETFRNRDVEYKWFCIRGDCPIMAAISGRGRTYFTQGKMHIKYLEQHKQAERYVRLTSNTTWNTMKRVSHSISKKFEFVRVDFSITNRKLYLDELTFTTTACTYIIRDPQRYLNNIRYIC